MIITRSITKDLLENARHYPVVCVMGPRQSGKTTLVRQTFSEHGYVSLEDPDIRLRAHQDPRAFLKDFATSSGLILDEIQRVPELLSYLQTIVDNDQKSGFFIITGSQNLLISQAITQTLAGRVSITTLLPLSIAELTTHNLLPQSLETAVFNGSYPKIYAKNTPPAILYRDYIFTYIERDIRSISNIGDLNTFQRFVQLCAGRTGQIINLSSLGNDCGIDHKTAKHWLSILEASYLVFLLYPFHQNYGKRLIKSPKLYFIDTGIACALLNIKSDQELLHHYLRGNLIESFIIGDMLKQQLNANQRPSLYFWRDQVGHEIDLIIEHALSTTAIEIKAGKTVSSDYFKNLSYVNNLHKNSTHNIVIYAGEEEQSWSNATVLSWKNAQHLAVTKFEPIDYPLKS